MRSLARVGVAVVSAVALLAGGLAGVAVATTGTTRAAFTSSIELPFGPVGVVVEPEPAASPAPSSAPSPTPTPARGPAVPPLPSASPAVTGPQDHDDVEGGADPASAPASSAPVTAGDDL